jgi:Protein of unknown function (DUF2975)
MNANEIPPKANSRMSRIQKASKCLRLILQYGIPLWFIVGLALSVLEMDYGVKIPFFSKAAPLTQRSPTDSTIIFPLYWSLLLVMFLFWYRMVVKLFGFFEKGICFTAETVRCMQILGGLYFARFSLDLIFQFLIQDREMIMSRWSDLFTGFFIFFIGWLIDEARKIREEQELTV